MKPSFKHHLDADAYYKAMLAIQAASVSTKSWVKELRGAIKSKDEMAQAKARNRLLFAKEAILTAALEANAKLKTEKRRSLEYCLDLPGKFDFSKPFPESVRVYAKVKKPIVLGEPTAYRILHDHDICHRTAQHAVMRVLGQYFVPRAFQFTHLGVQAPIARAKLLMKAGYVFAARLDIIDFYRSFSADALITGLPLPKEVVEHAVVARHMKVVMDHGKYKGAFPSHFAHHTTEDQARQGIPLGAASSPIVGMICVSHLVWSTMQDVALLNYVDDFQLLARNPNALEKSIGKLTEAVSKLPGGQFKVKVKSESTAKKGIELLGHRLQLVDGTLHTTPTQANLEYIQGTLNVLDEKFGKACYAKKLDLVTEQYALTKGWASAFSECDNGAKRWFDYLLPYLEENAKTVGVSLQKLEEAIEPWMGYKPADYALGL